MKYAHPGTPGAIVTFKAKYGNYINGEFVAPVDGQYFTNPSPVTGKPIAEFPRSNAADIEKALDAAHAAAEAWGDTSVTQRSNILLKIADRIEQNLELLAITETWDNGKAVRETLNADVPLAADHFRYFAGCIRAQEGTLGEIDAKTTAYHIHEPLGVVGQIIPWNFPLLMAAWKLGPALSTGCCVVLKPAEQTPLTALRLAELIHEAGFPAGCVNVLPGYGPTAGAAVSGHMDLDKVAFTGSTSVGRIVMQAAASSNMKKVTLELGGKSPLIIMNDCDLDAAVAAAQVGVFFNQGQVCTASSRIFVHDSIHDAFVSKLVAASKRRTQGNPFQDVNMGPQVSQEQQEIVWNYVKSGKKDGAECVLGGKKVEESGYFIQPTIFTNVTDDMKIAREEIFGPVMSILKFHTLDEAIKRANKTMYGLAAGIFTNDINNALKYASQVKAGTVWINTYNSFDTAQPFGGYKQSGIGRELGEYALEAYTEVKTVMIKLNEAPVKN